MGRAVRLDLWAKEHGYEPVDTQLYTEALGKAAVRLSGIFGLVLIL